MIDQESLASIENLHRMKAEGIITEAEFEQSKQKILFGQRPPKQSAAARSGNDARPAASEHIGWIILPLKRYADFKGRSSRKEFWMFQLIYLALFVVGAVMVGGTMDQYGEPSGTGTAVMGLLVLAFIGLFVPLIAVEVRRFHDQDRSGWFALLNLIPYAGVLIVLIMMVLPGTEGDNRFGTDPKMP